ncbi:hypothetical protein DPMN_010354 [Dreissena polymorpha]|uniref:Uncharacterized protein n=1 Tax=Dreissena polymorpha TaxID=45954 RepID=A0A9D4S0Y9_DREPO|nr:hypothetical protein DPMN_010354 [Dreissena polymorpha]
MAELSEESRLGKKLLIPGAAIPNQPTCQNSGLEFRLLAAYSTEFLGPALVGGNVFQTRILPDHPIARASNIA